VKYVIPALMSTLLVAASGYAEPITAGSMLIDISQEGGTVTLTGQNFAFTGGVGLGDIGTYAPTAQCRFGCSPGTIDAGMTVRTPYTLSGAFTLDGRSFPFDANSERANLEMTFASTLIPPAQLETGSFTLISPFSLTGRFLWYDVFGLEPSNPQIDFWGAGTLRALMESDGTQLYMRSAEYDFAHAPEPATLWLMATGIAVIIFRRRSRPTRQAVY